MNILDGWPVPKSDLNGSDDGCGDEFEVGGRVFDGSDGKAVKAVSGAVGTLNSIGDGADDDDVGVTAEVGEADTDDTGLSVGITRPNGITEGDDEDGAIVDIKGMFDGMSVAGTDGDDDCAIDDGINELVT